MTCWADAYGQEICLWSCGLYFMITNLYLSELNTEVHAALAAALYVDKHAPLLAENQFAIATLLDPHYTDLSYVKETKHWPPSLVCSLQQFFELS